MSASDHKRPPNLIAPHHLSGYVDVLIKVTHFPDLRHAGSMVRHTHTNGTREGQYAISIVHTAPHRDDLVRLCVCTSVIKHHFLATDAAAAAATTAATTAAAPLPLFSLGVDRTLVKRAAACCPARRPVIGMRTAGVTIYPRATALVLVRTSTWLQRRRWRQNNPSRAKRGTSRPLVAAAAAMPGEDAQCGGVLHFATVSEGTKRVREAQRGVPMKWIRKDYSQLSTHAHNTQSRALFLSVTLRHSLALPPLSR